MLSISNPIHGPAAVKYYLGFTSTDYYTERGERVGRFFGAGAKLLGAEGVVSAAVLKNLFDGFSPDRKQALVQNAGARDRQAAYDLTFSAPKSLSVLWATSSPFVQRKIAVLHARAVKRALKYLERVAGQTRRGHAGLALARARVLFAVFHHSSSRALDPALHSHCLLLNLGVREDGSVGALRTNAVFLHKMAAGAVYRATLAALLMRKLGVEIERDRFAFKIKGVQQQLCDYFSKRRQAIEQILTRRGVFNAEAAKLAALESRPQKQHVPVRELITAWQEEGRSLGWTTRQADSLLQRQKTIKDVLSVRDALVSEGIGRLAHQEGHFSERDLVRWVAEESQGRGIDGDQVVEGVRRGLTLAGVVELDRGRDGQTRYTTQAMLKVEKRLMARVESSRSSTRHVIKTAAVERALKSEANRRRRRQLPPLSAEQRAAILHIATRPGSIQVVEGGAGTGKSSLFQAAGRILKKQGFRVVGVALSGKAAQELEASSGLKCSTITSALLDLRSGPLGLSRGRKTLFPHAPKWSPLNGVSAPVLQFRNKPVRLSSKTVLVVDEASMVDTHQMEALLKAAAKARAKVVLVGDHRQLQSIEAGGSFKAIAQKLGSTSLTQIQRQKEDWAKEMVSLFSHGDAKEALAIASRQELLHCSETRAEVKAMLIDHWKNRGVLKPQQNLILVGTNADADEMNALAQAQRSKAGQLGWVGVKINGQRLYKGDRVLFEKNARALGVANGTLGTVSSVDRKTLVARLDDGRYVDIPLRQYNHVRLGYAVTSHKAQGMTTRNAYILIDRSIQHREITYVQASRATALTRFYADEATAGKNLADLSKLMSRSREKVMATSFQEQDRNSEHSEDRRKEEKRRQQSGQRSHSQSQSQSQSR